MPRKLQFAQTVKRTSCPICGNHIAQGFTWGEDGQLHRDNHRVHMSPKELGVIQKLARSAGVIVSRTSILDDVWMNEDVFERTIDVHVRRIRHSLGDRGSFMIETVKGFGYKWNGPKLYV